MQDKLGILVTGGGLKCALIAGNMHALAEVYGINQPRFYAGGSGGAPFGFGQIANILKTMREFWENEIYSGEIFPWRSGLLVNIQGLVEKVREMGGPFEDAVRSSETDYLIPATNKKTGELRYFSNRMNVDLFEAMNASMSPPIEWIWDQPAYIDGEEFFDSILISEPRTHLEKAIEYGAEKILIFENHSTSRFERMSTYIFNQWLLRQEKGFKRGYEESVRKAKSYNPPKNIPIYVHRQRPRTDTFGLTCPLRGQRIIKEEVNRGYESIAKNPGLEAFLLS